MKLKFFYALGVFIFMNLVQAEAAPLSFGATGGVDFPLSHTERLDPGPRVEAFYRLDPYEVRFHYSSLNEDYYGIVLGQKFFFTQDEIRPFFEAAGGLGIVDTDGEGLAYGLNPELSLGAELGINKNFSAITLCRYSAYWVFGDTSSGAMEAHHSLVVMGGVSLWF